MASLLSIAVILRRIYQHFVDRARVYNIPVYKKDEKEASRKVKIWINQLIDQVELMTTNEEKTGS
jgi:hypothetical protein